jgi:hypothetical protein
LCFALTTNWFNPGTNPEYVRLLNCPISRPLLNPDNSYYPEVPPDKLNVISLVLTVYKFEVNFKIGNSQVNVIPDNSSIIGSNPSEALGINFIVIVPLF